MSVNYHLVHEELNMKILRVTNIMLMAYILPLWIQLFYIGEAGVISGYLPEIPDAMLGQIRVSGYVPALLVGNLVMVAFAALHEAIQNRIQNFWLYLMLHIILLASLALPMQINQFSTAEMAIAVQAGAESFVPSSDLGILSTILEAQGTGMEVIPRLVVACVIIMLAIGARIRETHAGYPTFGWLFVGIGMCAFSAVAKFHDMGTFGYIAEMLTAILVAMYYNAESLRHALGQTELNKMLPMSRVKQLNLMLMLFWLAVGVVMVAVFTLTGAAEALLGAVGTAVSFVLHKMAELFIWLMSLLPKGAAYSQTAQVYEEMQREELNPASALLLLIITAIWETMVQIMKVGGCIFLVWFLIHNIRVMIASFQAARLEEKEVKSLALPDEARTLVRVKREKNLSFWNRTPAASIRRQYIALVRSSAAFREEYRESQTPREIEERVLMAPAESASSIEGAGGVETAEKGENVDAAKKVGIVKNPPLTKEVNSSYQLIWRLYEKARYVPETCTAEDARSMREAVRRVRDAREKG